VQITASGTGGILRIEVEQAFQLALGTATTEQFPLMGRTEGLAWRGGQEVIAAIRWSHLIHHGTQVCQSPASVGYGTYPEKQP